MLSSGTLPLGVEQDISKLSPGTKYDLVALICKGPMIPEKPISSGILIFNFKNHNRDTGNTFSP